MLVSLLLLVAGTGRGQAQAPCNEPNDEPAVACGLTVGEPIQSTIDRTGDVDLFRFVVGGSGGRTAIDLTELPADYDLYLIDDNGSVLGQSVREGPAAEALVLSLRPGTYFVVVQADPGRAIDASRPYTLRVTLESGATAASGEGAGGQAAATTTGGTVSAMPAPQPPALERPVLFEDRFDDPAVGLFPHTSRTPAINDLAYVEGEYHIRNVDTRPSNIYVGLVFGEPMADAILAVDVRVVGDTNGRNVAVFCRRLSVPEQEGQITAYRFVVTPADRGVELQRYDKSMRVSLGGRRISPAVNSGGDWNRLQISCIGSHISASINGQEIISVEDATYTEGQLAIGIFGPSAARPRGEMRLDNLIVYGP